MHDDLPRTRTAERPAADTRPISTSAEQHIATATSIFGMAFKAIADTTTLIGMPWPITFERWQWSGVEFKSPAKKVQDDYSQVGLGIALAIACKRARRSFGERRRVSLIASSSLDSTNVILSAYRKEMG